MINSTKSITSQSKLYICLVGGDSFINRLLFLCKEGECVSDSFKTLKENASAECEVKHSRFIGYASPVESERAALEFVAAIKKKHWDATHNVFAYRIKEGGAMRFSDDGEPQGTAGMPVLTVLTGEEVTDCVVVVTRYFGGTLLGTGGLVRAYSEAAKLAVNAAGVVSAEPWSVFKAVFDYSSFARMEKLIKNFEGVCDNTEFTDKVELSFSIKSKKKEFFLHALAEEFAGKIISEDLGEKTLI